MDLSELLTEREGSEIAGAVLDFVGVQRRGFIRAGWPDQPLRLGSSVDPRFLVPRPVQTWRAAGFHGAATLGPQLSQQPGHILGVLGYTAGQHGPDLGDIGAARAQHQAQVGFLERIA